MEKTRVLILCTANSARSQMAEGLLRHLTYGRFEVFSAGTIATQVNPFAIAAMQERNIDISHHTSKALDQFLQESFDYVITVCDNAAETCPVFPGKAERIHWGFPDPAAVQGTDDEKLAAFVAVRNDIETHFNAWLAAL